MSEIRTCPRCGHVHACTPSPPDAEREARTCESTHACEHAGTVPHDCGGDDDRCGWWCEDCQDELNRGSAEVLELWNQERAGQDEYEARVEARRAQARERLGAGVAELAARGLAFPLPPAPPGGKPS